MTYLASVERLSAVLPTERVDSPEGQTREQWLNVAESFLAFYVAELRRLEDLGVRSPRSISH